MAWGRETRYAVPRPAEPAAQLAADSDDVAVLKYSKNRMMNLKISVHRLILPIDVVVVVVVGSVGWNRCFV
jgi:hypothetical protein